MSTPTIVYIAGYGRSGSTLLERVLGNHQRIRAVGELAQLGAILDDSESLCSCGQEVRRCVFWSDILHKDIPLGPALSGASAARGRMESLGGILERLRGRKPKVAKAYAEYNRELFKRIALNGDGADFVIDSSKTAFQTFFRPTALSRIAGLNVKVVHLVRDGRGCIWSCLKGSNRKMERGRDPRVRISGLRAAVGWMVANLGAHLFQIMSPGRDYCRIRYEDFIDSPEEALDTIATVLGVSLDRQANLLATGKTIPVAHQVAGNRLRSQKAIVLRKDFEWQTALPVRYRLLFGLFGWPLAVLYRYPLRHSQS